GSSAPGVNGSLGYMQPAGSRATASCTWQFGQGAAAPPAPPAIIAQAVPTPGGAPPQSPSLAPGSGSPQPAGTQPVLPGGGTTLQPAGGAPAGASTPTS